MVCGLAARQAVEFPGRACFSFHPSPKRRGPFWFPVVDGIIPDPDGVHETKRTHSHNDNDNSTGSDVPPSESKLVPGRTRDTIAIHCNPFPFPLMPCPGSFEGGVRERRRRRERSVCSTSTRGCNEEVVDRRGGGGGGGINGPCKHMQRAPWVSSPCRLGSRWPGMAPTKVRLPLTMPSRRAHGPFPPGKPNRILANVGCKPGKRAGRGT